MLLIIKLSMVVGAQPSFHSVGPKLRVTTCLLIFSHEGIKYNFNMMNVLMEAFLGQYIGWACDMENTEQSLLI